MKIKVLNWLSFIDENESNSLFYLTTVIHCNYNKIITMNFQKNGNCFKIINQTMHMTRFDLE